MRARCQPVSHTLARPSTHPRPPHAHARPPTRPPAHPAGVPCLTLAGACHAHNVGASLLSAVGLAPRWVARSECEYVARAAQLAGDLPTLCTLRASLRARMEASPLCDAPAFVRGLEGEYHLLWGRWVDAQRAAEAAAAAAQA